MEILGYVRTESGVQRQGGRERNARAELSREGCETRALKVGENGEARKRSEHRGRGWEECTTVGENGVPCKGGKNGTPRMG